jgi:hypothetical protein
MHKIAVMKQLKIQRSDYKEKIEIDHGWAERIGKTAYNLANNHEKNDEHNNFIIESNDAGALGSIGWAIERNLDAIPSKLKPTFRKILEDTKARKENLERS